MNQVYFAGSIIALAISLVVGNGNPNQNEEIIEI